MLRSRYLQENVNKDTLLTLGIYNSLAERGKKLIRKMWNSEIVTNKIYSFSVVIQVNTALSSKIKSTAVQIIITHHNPLKS